MQALLERVMSGQDLEPAQMEKAMDAFLSGEATPAQMAGLLVALRMKGETAAELAAAARAMRRHAVPVVVPRKGPLLDTCGTGGDGSNSFNVSTATAIVVAACGVRVAKHGNRAASSRAGSADVLEALGVDLSLTPEQIASSIEQVGIGFMFARSHHPAMRHAGPVRAELGVRTLFNFLGPLTNPASATHQLLGVSDPSKLRLIAEVLGLLGIERAWVVHGAGAAGRGIDEVSVAGPTRVAEVSEKGVRETELTPEDFGVERSEPDALRGGDAHENAAIVRAVLAGERGPRRDAVVVNAASALCVAGVASAPREGAALAAQAIDSGAAASKLGAWIELGRPA